MNPEMMTVEYVTVPGGGLHEVAVPTKITLNEFVSLLNINTTKFSNISPKMGWADEIDSSKCLIFSTPAKGHGPKTCEADFDIAYATRDARSHAGHGIRWAYLEIARLRALVAQLNT